MLGFSRRFGGFEPATSDSIRTVCECFSYRPTKLFDKGENQMVFKRVFVPMVVLGIMLAMGSMAFAQTPAINCTIASTGAGLPGPSARATSTGHTEPVAAGPDETAANIGGGGTVRVTCTNTSTSLIPAAPAAPRPVS